MKQFVSVGAILLAFVVVTVGLYRLMVWINRPAGLSDEVTWEAYEQTKAGIPLKEIRDRFGPPAKVVQADVEEAFRSRPGDLDGMVKQYAIVSWHRWINKTAKLFVGVRQQGEALQVAVVGFIDNDQVKKNFASGWTVLPITASLEVGAPPPRTPVGQPVGQRSPADFERIPVGMSAVDVVAAVGSPDRVVRASTAVVSGMTTELEHWTYWANLSTYRDLSPVLAAGSVGAAASVPLSLAAFFLPRHYGWQVTLENKKVVRVTPLDHR